MFVVVTFATLPINIFLVKMIGKSSFFEYDNIVTNVFCGFVIYAVLFAVEQIMFGIITRFFYRRQYKLFKYMETTSDTQNVI